ncbi:AraC family transcriptional regulator [Paracoccus sp. DMF-8]|uniref:AraC family transcriptional regulator n=1 Tax=Paracoccus sp. DMF-8 TaxID=3019445 RepID=UPI0023E7FBC5|nr:AraC family transcriptional regulator [Paracoccus sp. DMF-8]MDF3606450.1 AraC family transcriptional regulator [Paracoccus sp. DMF-8]
MQRLRRARIAEGQILRPGQRDPRAADSGSAPLALVANSLVPPHRDPPFSIRPDRHHGRLAHFPLAGFTWGGAIRGTGRGIGRASAPRVWPDHLLIHVTSGSLRLEQPRLDRLLQADTLTFIPLGTAFSLLHLSEVRGDVLAVPAALVRKLGTILPDGIVSGRPSDEDGARIGHAIARLSTMGMLRDSALLGLAGQQLNQLSLTLSRLQEAPQPDARSPAHSRNARPLTDRFMRLVQREMENAPTLGDLAQELGVTIGMLDRACRAARGRSALDLMYDLRLERAVTLLKERRASPAEIAVRLGYVGLSHMKRAFIAATGRGPEDFVLMNAPRRSPESAPDWF